MSSKRSDFYEALNYKNGFRDGYSGEPKAFFSRMQTGPQRDAYDEGYEDGLRQRELEGHRHHNLD